MSFTGALWSFENITYFKLFLWCTVPSTYIIYCMLLMWLMYHNHGMCIISYQETFSCNYIFDFCVYDMLPASHFIRSYLFSSTYWSQDNNSRWQLYWYWRIRSNYNVGKFCIIIQRCCFAGELGDCMYIYSYTHMVNSMCVWCRAMSLIFPFVYTWTNNQSIYTKHQNQYYNII